MAAIIDSSSSHITRYTAELNFIVNKVTSLHSIGKSSVSQKQEMSKPISEYSVAFTGDSYSYCIGFVDMVNSSKISSSLKADDWCKYYGIFLNTLSSILKPFGGEVIKSIGDSLLYYFPASKKEGSFGNCIEAGMVLIEARDAINEVLRKEGLPPICYRVSSDYGRVVVMSSNKSTCIDLIGPPVNMCVKINHKADKNQMVLGGDLHRMVKGLKDYDFKLTNDFSLGFKLAYPVYTVKRKTPPTFYH